jgi:acetyl-CoA acetyltransferase
MKDSFPRGKTAIVSAATFGMGEAPGFTSKDLAAHAAIAALAQANLRPADVDGLFVCLSDDMLSGMTIAEYLGIRPKLTDNNRTGGSSFLIHVMLAALALESRQCEIALIAYGSNQRTATGKLANLIRTSVYEAPYKALSPISAYALAAARHMHQYGTTREHFGAVAIAARKWARLNPQAFMRDELTMDDYLRARLVSDPLGVRDCCLVTDGAAAIVMTRAERAKDHASRPAFVLGAASATWHQEISNATDLTVTAAAESGARAYTQAGVKAADIDVVQLYDAFTINTVLFLEDLGFCPKGEGGRFVESGRIAPGGELPVNTNGGGLSCVHPGMYGLFTLVEATQQLMHIAGERQLPDVHLALCHGNGGVLSSQATVILGSETTL